MLVCIYSIYPQPLYHYQCNIVFPVIADWPVMRPDPYKQERTRKYLAKKRAQGALKGKSGDSAEAKPSRIPSWLRNLPSNEARYETGETEQVTSLPEDDYDIYSLDQLADLSPTSPLTNDFIVNNTPVLTEEASALYRELTNFQVPLLAASLGPATTVDELQDVPIWLRSDLLSSAAAVGPGDRMAPKSSKLSSLSSLKKKKEESPAPSNTSPSAPPSSNDFLDELLNK